MTGVTGVSNQIIVKPHSNSLTISDDIRHALHRFWMCGENKVFATCGKVHLRGAVDNLHGREPVAATAWAAPGTTSVSNEILVG